MKNLSPAQLKQLREIFDAAISEEASRRDAFVKNACGTDTDLRAAVNQLLRAHSRETVWLDKPLLHLRELPTGDNNWPGTEIGPYRVECQLGRGGMATVLLADREIGRVSLKVALKLIHPSLMSNEEMRRRFEHEKEILAALDHPSIARLLDVGSTIDGTPYLVMEYVPGERLDEHCRHRGLNLEDRLSVFCQMCEVVDYAHSRGVIHRDLKPSNVIINSEGRLKLLDFGIAKVSGVSDQFASGLTGSGISPMTVDYASPEQIQGGEISKQTDVYSLGVMLYELLTGIHPWRNAGESLPAVLHAICEVNPLTPSSAVLECPLPDAETATSGGASRKTDDRLIQLSGQLSGDLDSIILKALRREPQWRYSSAGALAEDIRRHIAGDRVLARQDTLKYRTERVLRKILHARDATFHSQGMMLCTAGLLGTVILYERYQISAGAKASVSYQRNGVLIGVWLLWAISEGRRAMRAGRLSTVDQRSWTLFTAITVVLGVMTILGDARNVAGPEELALFWNAALSIGMLTVGLQADRLLTAGGLVLFLSVIAAILDPNRLYLWLAGGLLAGMSVPGAWLAFRPLRDANASARVARQRS